MAAIIEWKDQLKGNLPFIFAVASKFSSPSLKREFISSIFKQEIKGRLVFCDPSTGNPKIRNEADIAGSIVIMTRGGNTFAQKYANAAALGASLVIFANMNDSSPNTVLIATGDLAKCGVELPDFGNNFPPCCMISLAAYKRLRLETPFTLTITPLQQSHMSKLQSYDFGAAIRAMAMVGNDVAMKDLFNEIAQRYSAAEDKSKAVDIRAVLNEGEVGRGATACHIAVECKQLSCLSLLLKCGANSEIVKSDGYSPLHIAAINNDIESVSLLIEGAAYIDHPHPTGWTAIHLACKYGSFDALQIMIEAGGDVNARASDGSTALHIACLLGFENAVSQLIRAGADATIETVDGMGPSAFALYCGFPNCVAIIEKHAKIGQVRKLTEKRKSIKTISSDPSDSVANVVAESEQCAEVDADPGWASYADVYSDKDMTGEAAPSSSSSTARRRSSGGMLDQDELNMGDVFSSANEIDVVNTSRRTLQRKSSIRKSFSASGATPTAASAAPLTDGSSSNKYGLGTKWKASLNKICAYCYKEDRLSELEAMQAKAASIEESTISRTRTLSKVEDIIDVDLSRCCFIAYRTGLKRKLLKRLLQMILNGEVGSIAFDEGEDQGDQGEDGSDVSSQTWRPLAAFNILTYKQGLLSLLAPIVEVWFDFDAMDPTRVAATDSSAIDVTEDDKALLRNCSETFFALLYCFPSLTTYLCSDGSITSFQNIFDITMRVLLFWMPNIASCLAWRTFSPALFAVPWATTLMADVLSLADVQYLWTRIFEICEDIIASPDDAMLNGIGEGGEQTFGDALLTCMIVSSVMQLSNYIDPIHCSRENSDSGVNANAFLPTQEELLVLFSSTNNDAFHESLFESKKQQQQPDSPANNSSSRLAKRTSPAPTASRQKRMNIGEIARSISWLLRHTPQRIMLQPSSISTQAKNNFQPTIWSVVGGIPVMSVSEIWQLKNQLNMKVLIISVSQFSSGGYDASLSSINDNESEGFLSSQSLQSQLESESTSVNVLLLQQLKMSGMTQYLSGLATELCVDFSRKAQPLGHLPRPPTALRTYLCKPGEWKNQIVVSSVDDSLQAAAASLPSAAGGAALTIETSPAAMEGASCPPISPTAASATASSSYYTYSADKYVIVLARANSSVPGEILVDVGATLVTCGFSNLVIAEQAQ